jgi:hypothetical protein
MDHDEPGVATAVAHLAELRRHAGRWRLARRMPGRSAGRRGNRARIAMGPPARPLTARAGAAAAAARGPRPTTTEKAMLTR